MGNKPHNRPKKAKVKKMDLGFSTQQLVEQLVADKQNLETRLYQAQVLTTALLLAQPDETFVISKETLDVIANGAVDGIGIEPGDDAAIVLKIARAEL